MFLGFLPERIHFSRSQAPVRQKTEDAPCKLREDAHCKKVRLGEFDSALKGAQNFYRRNDRIGMK